LATAETVASLVAVKSQAVAIASTLALFPLKRTKANETALLSASVD